MSIRLSVKNYTIVHVLIHFKIPTNFNIINKKKILLYYQLFITILLFPFYLSLITNKNDKKNVLVKQRIKLAIYLSFIYPSIYTHMCVCMTYLSIYPYLSVHLSIYLSNQLYIVLYYDINRCGLTITANNYGPRGVFTFC